MRIVTAVLSLLVLASCPGEPTPIVSQDVLIDSASDITVDDVADGADAAPDAATDAATDLVSDVPADALIDAPADGIADSAPDTQIDSADGSDAAAEADTGSFGAFNPNLYGQLYGAKLIECASETLPFLWDLKEALLTLTYDEQKIQTYFTALAQYLADRPHVTVDESKWAECAATLQPGVCLDPTQPAQTQSPCIDMFVGALAAGEVCTLGLECSPGHTCTFDSQGCSTCEATVGEGEDCSTSPCEDGFVCDGVCTALSLLLESEVGDPCTGLEGCNLDWAGHFCDPETNACVQAEVVAEGGACDAPVGGYVRRCKNENGTHYCNVASGSNEGTCDALPIAGEPCASENRCNTTVAWCNTASGMCEQAIALGETCAVGPGEAGCAAPSFCNAGTCAGSFNSDYFQVCEE